MLFKSFISKLRKFNKIVLSYLSLESVNYQVIFNLPKKTFAPQIIFLQLLAFLFI